MFGWTKSSDWLPVAEAKAQVDFYERDLQYSEQYFAFVNSLRGRVPKWTKQYLIAKKDVQDSIRNLANSKLKLLESEALDAKTTKWATFKKLDGTVI